MATQSKHSLADLQAGHKIYTQTCFSCHSQPDAQTYETEDWLAVVDTMGSHAGLAKADSKLVGKYIHARSLAAEKAINKAP